MSFCESQQMPTRMVANICVILGGDGDRRRKGRQTENQMGVPPSAGMEGIREALGPNVCRRCIRKRYKVSLLPEIVFMRISPGTVPVAANRTVSSSG